MGFAIKAAADLGIAFPGLWETLAKGVTATRLVERLNSLQWLHNKTLYLGSPDFERMAPAGTQEHWPVVFKEEPFQAIHAWLRLDNHPPQLIAVGLEGQGLILLN